MVPKNRIASGMFYSKINYNFNKYQNNLTSKNVRSFKSADNSVDFQKDNNEPDNLEETKFSEDEIYRLSAFVPDKKMSEVAKNTVKTMFVTIPVIDSVIAGAVEFQFQRQQAAGHGQVLKAGGGALEHAEHPLMGGALRQLFGHVLLHQIALPPQVFQRGGLFQRRGGIIYYL